MKRIRMIVKLTLALALLSLLSTAGATAGAGPLLHQASGSGFFYTPPKVEDAPGNEFMFAFNARQLNNDGDVEGHFAQHNLTNGNVLHLEIISMEVEGKDVWLIGKVTLSVGASAEIGDERAVRLRDNGEGKNAIDMRSKLSSTYDPDASLSEQEFQLIELDGGNIQVRMNVSF